MTTPEEPGLIAGRFFKRMIPDLNAKDVARFNSRVSPRNESGCRLWTGTVATNGYGSFAFAGSRYSAHAVSHLIHIGRSDQQLLICHTCDVRLCVEPSHLFTGTHAENLLDCVHKGRNGNPRGSTHPRAKIKESDVPGVVSMLRSRVNQNDIAKKYGITRSSVSMIAMGRNWSWLTGIKRQAAATKGEQ